MAAMIKNEAGPKVMVTIDLPTPDKDFPPIQGQATLKKLSVHKTCDEPKLVGMQISTGQVAQAASYIRAEQELEVTIEQIENELPFEEDDTE